MRQLTIQTFIYYLIYSDARKEICKISNARKIGLSCSIEMHHFQKLLCVKQNIQMNKLRNFAKYLAIQKAFPPYRNALVLIIISSL